MLLKTSFILHLVPFLVQSSRIKRQEGIPPPAPSDGPKTLPQDAGLQDPPATDSPPETFFPIPDDSNTAEIVPQSGGTCVDLYDSCKTTWKGLCNADSIKKNCPLSCDTCEEFGDLVNNSSDSDEGPVCEDAPGTLCVSNVINSQVCQDIDMIRQSCPKSCGLCEVARDQPLIDSGGFVKGENDKVDMTSSMVDTFCVDDLPDGTCSEFKNECDKTSVYSICRKTCNKCEDFMKRLINEEEDDDDEIVPVDEESQPVETSDDANEGTNEEQPVEVVDDGVTVTTTEAVVEDEVIVENNVEEENEVEENVEEEEAVEDETVVVEDENNSIVNSNNNQVVSTGGDTNTQSSSSSITTTFLLLLLTIAIAF